MHSLKKISFLEVEFEGSGNDFSFEVVLIFSTLLLTWMISLMKGAKVTESIGSRHDFSRGKVTCRRRKTRWRVIEGLPETPFVLEEIVQLLILDLGCIRSRLQLLSRR
jgi:hypothetical protein